MAPNQMKTDTTTNSSSPIASADKSKDKIVKSSSSSSSSVSFILFQVVYVAFFVCYFAYNVQTYWTDNDKQYGIYCAVGLTIYYVIGRYLLYVKTAYMHNLSVGDSAKWTPEMHTEWEKSRAWLLSFSAAVFCSIVGIHMTYLVYVGGPQSIANLGMSDAYYSRPAVLFYYVQLLFDVVFGILDYYRQVDILSGWVHHFVYLLLISWLVQNQYTGALATVMNNEIPTLILGIGHIHKPWRMDLPFGITFFLTRILFDVYVVIVHWKFTPHTSFGPLSSPLLFLHMYWFYGWIISYQKTLRKQRTADKTK